MGLHARVATEPPTYCTTLCLLAAKMASARPNLGTLTWRAMEPIDAQHVYDVANRVHLDFPEDLGVFTERQSLCPDGCLVLYLDDGSIVGYCLSHPYVSNDSPPLNTLIGSLPSSSDTWYIHDVAMLKEYRGRGAAASVIAALKEKAAAAKFKTISLTAVGGADSFWAHQGFIVDDSMADHGASYGDTAIFMRLRLNVDAD